MIFGRKQRVIGSFISMGIWDLDLKLFALNPSTFNSPTFQSIGSHAEF